MLSDGFKLMITGMGTVFIFLSLMIIIIILLSRFLAPFVSILDKRQTAFSAVSDNRTTGTNTEDPGAIITAIVTAVHKFREQRGKDKI
jgi:oxaloacetate decarboxylase (Na+ extruding) subunit gamma